MEKLFAIIQWEDLFVSTLDLENVRFPRRNVDEYAAGEYIMAKYKGQNYKAVICEIHHDRQHLESHVKQFKDGHRPLKFALFGTDDSDTTITNEMSQEDEHVSAAQDMSHAQLDSGEKGRAKTMPKPDVHVSVTGTCTKRKKQGGESAVSSSKKQKKLTENESTNQKDVGTQQRKEKSQDEAHTVAAQLRKVQREISSERQKKEKELGERIFNSSSTNDHDMYSAQKDKEWQQKFERLESKVDSILSVLGTLVDCRNCLKKAYKNTYSHQQTPVHVTQTPVHVTQTPVHVTQTPVHVTQTPVHVTPSSQQTMFAYVTPSTSRRTLSEMDAETSFEMDQEFHGNNSAEDEDNCSVEILADNADSGTQEKLVFLGDSRYGVKLNEVSVKRCCDTAKTAEKLARNLVEFLFTEEEFKSVSVYGNKQHNKKPMDESKRKALRSFIFSQYHTDKTREEKEVTWEKIVKTMNDKIRKRK